ncbi:MAG: NosD domain-containing protein [Methanogenium sp.]|jgi:parallel beta-helix repeat protein
MGWLKLIFISMIIFYSVGISAANTYNVSTNSELQNAIQQADSINYNHIYIQNGVYEPITISTDNIALIGSSNTAINGVSIGGFNNILLIDCDIADGGLRISNADNITIANSKIFSNTIGIQLQSVTNTSIISNNIYDNSVGLYLADSSNLVVYNNIFNNIDNIQCNNQNYDIAWNTSRTSSLNIVGGSVVGGNYWCLASGNGFSQTHSDDNDDGIADSVYYINVNDTNLGIDYLPLIYVEPYIEPAKYPPVASFRVNTTQGSAPLTIEYISTAINASTFYWDFDGDGISESQTPVGTYTYNNPGTYTLIHRVSNSDGDDSATRLITVDTSIDIPDIIDNTDDTSNERSTKATGLSHYIGIVTNITSNISNALHIDKIISSKNQSNTANQTTQPTTTRSVYVVAPLSNNSDAASRTNQVIQTTDDSAVAAYNEANTPVEIVSTPILIVGLIVLMLCIIITIKQKKNEKD